MPLAFDSSDGPGHDEVGMDPSHGEGTGMEYSNEDGGTVDMEEEDAKAPDGDALLSLDTQVSCDPGLLSCSPLRI